MSDLEVRRAYSDLCLFPIFLGAPLMLVSAYIVLRPNTPIAAFDGVEYFIGGIGAIIILGSIAIGVWGNMGDAERMRRCLKRLADDE